MNKMIAAVIFSFLLVDQSYGDVPTNEQAPSIELDAKTVRKICRRVYSGGEILKEYLEEHIFPRYQISSIRPIYSQIRCGDGTGRKQSLLMSVYGQPEMLYGLFNYVRSQQVTYRPDLCCFRENFIRDIRVDDRGVEVRDIIDSTEALCRNFTCER